MWKGVKSFSHIHRNDNAIYIINQTMLDSFYYIYKTLLCEPLFVEAFLGPRADPVYYQI